MAGSTSAATKQDGCKGCDPSFRTTVEAIDRMLDAPMFRSAEHTVPDDVYAHRLALCGTCPKLSGGETCAVCGCYVRVAAKLKAKSCPLPGGGEWQAIAANN